MSQLSARAAYGAELRRQIEEKDREKKAKRGIGQQQQNQHSQSVDQGIFSKNRYEFERARMAGGTNSLGLDALQRPAAGNMVLPPLNTDTKSYNVDNIWNRSSQPQAAQRQHPPDFRSRNEITAPGKLSACKCAFARLISMVPWMMFLCMEIVTCMQASMMLQLKMNGSASSRNTG